jgi:predicted aldo/keto reductase-like oxidoreductase
LEYSTIGFGAMRTSDPAVIRKAIDQGVNHIDTARGYMDGYNEVIISNAISDIRKKVFISTKLSLNTPDRMLKDAEVSLQTLKTDYIDVLMLHSTSGPEEILNQDVLNLFEKLKKDGKVRYTGFSTHRNMAKVIRAALTDKFYDVALLAYNFRSIQDVKKAVAEAAAADMGVIAMKTQAGDYRDENNPGLSPHQATLKWVLSDKNITAAIPSMITFDQMQENVRVMGQKLGWLDRRILDRYSRVTDSRLCRMCGQCVGQCPRNAAISEINRCIMYADAYGDRDLAMRNYRLISSQENLEGCRDCVGCHVKCASGLDIAARIKRGLELFV